MLYNMKRVGAACREYRKNLGLTQKAVAVEIGVSKELISAFENGRANNAYILLWYLEKGIHGRILAYVAKEEGWR